ncbi:MAG: hypothetical protein M1144_01465 [Candidatus Thermoplasmatota archaeon]|jgi:hypothetical protein|nr:hypothetical protein [Candidatus Thermoplasmatota archaeon]MCL5984490.1 hypothetical protein [Candidatus Thermoplasmatota archaeon]
MVGAGRKSEKTVHHHFDPTDETVTLETVLSMIEQLRKKHPDREIFFDGDEYSICSRPRHTKHGTHSRA